MINEILGMDDILCVKIINLITHTRVPSLFWLMSDKMKKEDKYKRRGIRGKKERKKVMIEQNDLYL